MIGVMKCQFKRFILFMSPRRTITKILFSNDEKSIESINFLAELPDVMKPGQESGVTSHEILSS